MKRRTRSDKVLDEEVFSKHYGNVNSAHVPVMLGEVLDVFASVPLSSFVDCTLGAAGHSSEVGPYAPFLFIYLMSFFLHLIFFFVNAMCYWRVDFYFFESYWRIELILKHLTRKLLLEIIWRLKI